MKYDFSEIEKKWQAKWLKDKIYEPNLDKAKRPFYNLMMFPYPSAEGLHVGNMYAFTGSDIYGRFKRMQGYDVFEPIGLDGFGIHSENYAIRAGKHPRETTRDAEENFYRQFQEIGNGFAWDEKLETYDPSYYKWTQWIFVQMFKHGLAYRKKQPVNWCPSCKTVLADEQVIGGACERCLTKVEKRELEQWFFKITEYAERLLNDLEKLDWSERVKIAQRNWIGKSEGAEVTFELGVPKPKKFKLCIGTKNPAKKERYLKMFSPLGIDVVTIDDLGKSLADIEVDEGDDIKKNALMKAQAFYQATGLPTLAIDEALFIEKFPADRQPGSHVRRIPGFSGRPSDDDMLQYYIQEVDKHGGESLTHWEHAIAYVDESGTKQTLIRVTSSKIVSIKSRVVKPGYPLDSLLIDLRTGKYRSELTSREEEVAIKQLSDTLIDFVKSAHLSKPQVNVFTTRPDTLFGATYLVLSPEHPLVNQITTKEQRKAVDKYKEQVVSKSDLERTALEKEKTGVFTGAYAINPVNNEKIPVWIADYVLMSYGTGAIMAVPAHDERDFEFAKKYDLPVKIVICPHYPDTTCPILDTAYTGKGHLVDSGTFNGMPSDEAAKKIVDFVKGKPMVQYHLRDWLISRQRYWGPPIPMIYCESCARVGRGERKDMPGWYAVPEKDLPVELPFVMDFQPKGTGQSPLATVKEFYEVKCPGCGATARRETDVSDTFLDSAWYYLRYLDSKNDRELFDKQRARKWLPVDMYIGGAEHAVLHLLYVRFMAKVFHDWKLTDFGEPAKKFRAHGLLIRGGKKISKSKGNIVNPDNFIKEFGADAFRLHLMFLGPFEEGGDFRDRGILGPVRFLDRVWRLSKEIQSKKAKNKNKALENPIHRTIKKVTEDLEDLRYNTAVSALMALLNDFEDNKDNLDCASFEVFLKLLAPFAPHITEELWSELGHKTSIHKEEWPKYDPEKVVEKTFTLVIQVNGRVRDTTEAPLEIKEDEARRLALNQKRIREILQDKEIKKIVFVPKKLINFVVP